MRQENFDVGACTHTVPPVFFVPIPNPSIEIPWTLYSIYQEQCTPFMFYFFVFIWYPSIYSYISWSNHHRQRKNPRAHCMAYTTLIFHLAVIRCIGAPIIIGTTYIIRTRIATHQTSYNLPIILHAWDIFSFQGSVIRSETCNDGGLLPRPQSFMFKATAE